MKRSRWIHLVLAAAVLGFLVSCSDSASPTAPRAATAKEGTLAVGESLTVTTSVSIRFDEVVADSRCPTGVLCPWQGEATVGLTLRKEAAPESFQLSTRMPEVTVGGYRVRLVEITPYPVAGSPIPREAYRITIHVEG